MDRAWEMLEFVGEYPASNEILAAVHLKPKKTANKKPRNKKEAQGQLAQLSGMLGLDAAPLPPHLREMANWAMDLNSKMMQGKPN